MVEVFFFSFKGIRHCPPHFSVMECWPSNRVSSVLKVLMVGLVKWYPSFKVFLHLHYHMHHLLQLHTMMQLHNMSYIMIKGIHESSHSSLLILFNISSNHNKFHLLEILINILCILNQTLQLLTQFSIIVARYKSHFKGFHLILCINLPLIISLAIYH